MDIRNNSACSVDNMGQNMSRWLVVFLSIFVLAGVAALFVLLPYALADNKWDELPRVISSHDQNNNGISDTEDLIVGAREAVKLAPVYKNDYYSGGYPPATEGVCTDIIWQAMKYAGYDFKAMIDADMKANPKAYPKTSQPDTNINFRRVPNVKTYFARHGESLDTEIKPNDPENLATWQPGDIVTFANPDHVVILSDKRNVAGIPLVLHNDGPVASEEDAFMRWYERGITGHFRYPKN